MKFIDLDRQYDQISENLKAGFEKAMQDKHFIMGDEVRELEEALGRYTGRKHVVTCASGTDALVLPMMAYGLTKEDAVFVPSFTFFASGESVSLAGGTPVFVDSDEETFNISPDNLEQTIKNVIEEGKLTPKGIIAVDLFGLPADYEKIEKIAEKYGLFLLEDGAQGFGGKCKDKKACSFGDVSATSFFPAKPLGCYGDGGAVFTDDDKMAEMLRSLRVHGKGKNKYDNVRIGVNSRLDTLQAVVLINKLSIFDKELTMRNDVAGKYKERLKGYFKTPDIREGYYSSWAQYTLIADNEGERDRIIDEMKEAGIPVMIYYPVPMHRSGAYKNNKNYSPSLNTSEALSKRVFSIPMHPYLKDDEIEEICNKLIEVKTHCDV